MDKVRIALCDDEENALRIIASALGSVLRQKGLEVETAGFLRPDRLLERLLESGNAFDIVMLDIRMPRADGIRLAEEIRRHLGSDVKIVFVSNEESRVFEAFSVNAFFFIRKSRLIEDITAFCNHYLEAMQRDTARRVVNFLQNGAEVALYLNDIICVESQGRKQLIHIQGRDEPLALNTTMYEIEEKVADGGFIRVHKGYLVNNAYISRISGESVVLKNGMSVPISRRKLKEVHQEHMRLSRQSQTMLR